jgi:hypothetical protein
MFETQFISGVGEAMKKAKRPPAPAVQQDEEHLEQSLRVLITDMQSKPDWKNFLARIEALGKSHGVTISTNLSFEIEQV